MKIANLVILIGVFAALLAGCDNSPRPARTATPAPVATALDAATPSTVPTSPAPVATETACTTPAVTGKLNLLPLPGIVRGPAGMVMFQGRLYVAGSRSNNVGVIDNGQLSSVFATGGGSRDLVADEAAGKLFVLNVDELSVSMSDGQQVQATIPISNTALAQLHQEARAMVIDSQRHRLYVAINTSRPEIAVIDTQAFTISARIIFTNSHRIGPMALDTVNNRLFFAHSDESSDNISVLDLQTRQITEKIALGAGPHSTLLYDAASHRLYTDYFDPKAGGRGIVIDNGNEVGSFPAPIGPSEWLIVNQRLYMTNVFSSTVDVVDLQTTRQVASIGVGLYPNALLDDPGGERIYVSVRGAQNFAPESNRLEVIDTRRNEVTGLIPLAAPAPQLIGDSTRHRLYALLPSSSEVVISDRQRVLARVKLERAPFQMALDERAGRLYVSDELAHIISVIDVTAGQVLARVTPAIPADQSYLPTFMDSVAVDTRHNRLLVNNTFFPLDQLNATGNYTITDSPFGESGWPLNWLASPNLPRYYGISGAGLKSSFLLLSYDSETLQEQYSGIAWVSALALDDGAQRLYATAEALPPAGQQNTLYVRDSLTLSPIASLSLPARVTAMALNAKTHHLFMSYLAQASLPNASNNTVEVIDTRTLSRVATFRVSADPIAMAVLADSVYIASSTAADLTIVRDCLLPAPPPPPTPTPLPTATPVPTMTPINSPSPTPSSTATPTVQPTATPLPTPTVQVFNPLPTRAPYVNQLIVSPDNPALLFALTTQSHFARSDDGGATWKPLPTGVTGATTISGIGIEYQTPKVLYFTSDKGIFKSLNQGQTWTLVNPMSSTGITVDFNDANVLWTVVGTSSRLTAEIWRSTDGGLTWPSHSTGSYGLQSAGPILIDPHDSNTLYVVDDAGHVHRGTRENSWTYIPRPDPAYQGILRHGIAWSTNSNTLYVGSESPKL
jgi:YVTN family beta-propeller protein